MEQCSFISKNGESISIDGVCSHIGLALEMVKRDKSLEEDFKRSKKSNLVDFMILDKGYMKASNIGCYKILTYSGKKITDKQRKIIKYFASDGFSLDNLDMCKSYLDQER